MSFRGGVVGALGALALCAAAWGGSGVIIRPGDIVVAVQGTPVQFYVINTVTGDVDSVPMIGMVSSVGGIDVAPSGLIYFPEPDFGTVRKLNASTGALTPVENGLDDPRDLVIDGIGRVLVTEGATGQVSRINEANNSLVVVSEGGLLQGPRGIDLRSDGRIVVLDHGQSLLLHGTFTEPRVLYVDPSSGAQELLQSDGAWNDRAISVDPINDTIVFADGLAGGPSRLDPVTGAEIAFALPGFTVESIAHDRSGRVLLGTSAGDVYRFNVSSGQFEFLAGDFPGSVRGIAVAPTPGQPFLGSLIEEVGDGEVFAGEGGGVQIIGVSAPSGSNGARIRPGYSRIPAGYGVSFANVPENEAPNGEIELRLRGVRNGISGQTLGSVTLRKLVLPGQRRMLFDFDAIGSSDYAMHIFADGERVFEGPFVGDSFVNFADCGPVVNEDPYDRLDVGVVQTFPAADHPAPFISLKFRRCQSITPLGGGSPVNGDHIVIVREAPESQPAVAIDEVLLLGRGLNAIVVPRANIHKFGLEARGDAGTPLDATGDVLRMARSPFGPTTDMGTRLGAPFPLRPQGIRAQWDPVVEFDIPAVTTHGAAQPPYIEGNARGTINGIPDRDLGVVRITLNTPAVSTHGGPEYDMAGIAPAAGDGEFTLIVMDDGVEVTEAQDVPAASLAQVEDWPEAMGAVTPFYRVPGFSNPFASSAPPQPGPPSPFGSADEPQAYLVLQWPQDIAIVIDGELYLGDELLIGAEGVATPVDSVDAIRISTTGIPAMTFVAGVMIGVCPGDVNGDFEVDFADLNLVISNWETFPIFGTNGDANYDGFVDFSDLNFVISNWQAECP